LTRAWELLLGGMVAFVKFSYGLQWPKNNVVNGVIYDAGFILIVASFYVYDQYVPVPSYYTLLPLSGVALILLSNTPSAGGVARYVLTSKVVVFLGLISYSLYLWHYPILSFYRITLGTEDYDSLVIVGLVVAVIIISYFSWRFVEQPARKNNVISDVKIIQVFSVLWVFFIVVSLSGEMQYSLFGRYAVSVPDNVKWRSLGERLKKEGAVCNSTPNLKHEGVEDCYFGDLSSERTVVLYGDSHSDALSFELDQAFKNSGIRGLKVKMSECLPIPTFGAKESFDLVKCEKHFNGLLGLVEELNAEVIVSVRWMHRLYPLDTYSLDSPYRNSEGYTEADAMSAKYFVSVNGIPYYDSKSKRKAVIDFIGLLEGVSKELLIIGPVPETGVDVYRLNVNYYRETGGVLQDFTMPFSDYTIRNKFILEVLDRFSDSSGVKIILPADFLCNNEQLARCVIQYQSSLLQNPKNECNY